MDNFVIATNLDSRVEAFYVDETGTVMHTWQLESGNRQIWSAPNALFGTAPGSNGPLRDAVRVQATTGREGQIQVVAYTKANQYFICYQRGNEWFGWFQIQQQ
jgi:sugar lactone lactonase YvrE